MGPSTKVSSISSSTSYMLFRKAVCIRTQMYLTLCVITAKELPGCKSNFTLDLDRLLTRKKGSTSN